jgi:hypothetical protein
VIASDRLGGPLRVVGAQSVSVERCCRAIRQIPRFRADQRAAANADPHLSIRNVRPLQSTPSPKLSIPSTSPSSPTSPLHQTFPQNYLNDSIRTNCLPPPPSRPLPGPARRPVLSSKLLTTSVRSDPTTQVVEGVGSGLTLALQSPEGDGGRGQALQVLARFPCLPKVPSDPQAPAAASCRS